MYLRFSGALILTYNATSLILPGSANITTAAGDTAILESLGSGNWVCQTYTKRSGFAVVPTSNIKIGSLDRDVTAATGTVATTGVGFTPKMVFFFGAYNAANFSAFFGVSNVTLNYSLYQVNNSANMTADRSSCIDISIDNNATSQIATLSSLDADGFTLSWTKNGSPSAGTAVIHYIAIG